MRILLLLLITSQISTAQESHIQGFVRDKDSGEPVLFAHIYLANTAIGTTSDSKGYYFIKGIPEGKFTLICTMVGYEPFIREINLLTGEDIELMIELNTSVKVLDEIQLAEKEDKRWRRKFEVFKKEFLGNVPNAAQCEIINPWIVNFEDNRRNNIIKAYLDQPLIVVNNALGYRISFLLTHFEKENDDLFYLGYPSFDHLEIHDTTQTVSYEEKRKDTYNGSIRHFFYALVNQSLEEEGFLVYKISKRPSEKMIQSLKGSVVEHNLIPLSYEEVVHNSNPWGNFTIFISETLEIIYINKDWTDSPYWDAPNPVSRIYMIDELVVSKSGYVFNPASFVVSGYFSEERLANMLPFEYVVE